MEDTQKSFSSNCASLSKDLFALYSLPVAMSANAHYNNIASLSVFEDATSYYYVSRLINSFSAQCSLVSIADHYFLFFQNSGIILTPNAGYQNLAECFCVFNKFSSLEIERIFEDNDSFTHLSLYKEDILISDGKVERCLPLVMNVPTSRAFYLFTIPSDTLCDYFHMNTLPENSVLTVIGKDGSVLFCSEEGQIDNSEMEVLTGAIPEVSVQISLQIPVRYFSEITEKSRREAFLTYSIFAAVGLFLCIFFSWSFAEPVKRIMFSHHIDSVHGKENELSAISGFLEITKEQNLKLKKHLLFNLMARVFAGNQITEAEYEELQKMYAVFNGMMRISIMRYISTDGTPEFNRVLSSVKGLLPEDFICEPINTQEIGFILPADETSVEYLRSAYVKISSFCSEKDFINCGVSACFHDCKSLPSAVKQALYGLASGPSTGFYLFSEELPEQEEQNVPELLQDFRYALINWNISEIERIADLLEISVRHSTIPHCQEIYFGMLNAIKEVGYSINYPKELLENRNYDQLLSGLSNLHSLKKMIDNLISEKQKSQKEKAEKEERQILDYITNQCVDKNLTIDGVSSYFGRSSHYITNVISTLTGKTFSAYLSDLRMKKAAELLRDSDANIAEISEQCGLMNNTFYRNFKKYYNLTPAEYREKFK